jgi:hypothetical protein
MFLVVVCHPLSPDVPLVAVVESKEHAIREFGKAAKIYVCPPGFVFAIDTKRSAKTVEMAYRATPGYFPDCSKAIPVIPAIAEAKAQAANASDARLPEDFVDQDPDGQS